MNNCPCNPTNNYSDCCQPFHQGTIPHNAEQLMRSRYSAFALNLIDYIVATTVPSQQKILNVLAINNWSQTTDWQGLRIINHNPKVGKKISQVEFEALFKTSDSIDKHHELSTFVRIDNRWYFIDPTVTLPTLKQPCICGSSIKFKRCCGEFL